jgi:hypothetical protein
MQNQNIVYLKVKSKKNKRILTVTSLTSLISFVYENKWLVPTLLIDFINKPLLGPLKTG